MMAWWWNWQIDSVTAKSRFWSEAGGLLEHFEFGGNLWVLMFSFLHFKNCFPTSDNIQVDAVPLCFNLNSLFPNSYNKSTQAVLRRWFCLFRKYVKFASSVVHQHSVISFVRRKSADGCSPAVEEELSCLLASQTFSDNNISAVHMQMGFWENFLCIETAP